MERADLEQWRPKDVARLLALVETQRRYYQEIVAAIPVGILVLSPELEIILANRALRNMFGLPGGESLRSRVSTILPVWMLDRVKDVLKTGVAQTNILLETGQGAKRRFRIGILAVRTIDDEGTEALLSIEDLGGLSPAPAEPSSVLVPDRQVISAADLVDNLDAAIWAVDLDSMRFLFASRQAEKMLGFPLEQWTGRASFWMDRVHPSDRDRVIQSYRRAIERRETHACEFRAMTSAGGVVWLREKARLLADAEGRPAYLIGISIDVTERRLLEDQLIQSERAEAISKLASRMSHDLNNMLMVLTGYTEELLNTIPANSPLRAEVQEILSAAERITGLSNELLGFVRRTSTAPGTVELETVMGAVGHGGGLELKPSSTRTRVKANAEQLAQILTELIESLQSPEGKISIETSRVEIREDPGRANAALRPGRYAVISINGAQLPTAREPKGGWVENFLPGKDPSDRPLTVLARVYGIVRQWGGDIAVSNDSPNGSLIRIFLELVENPNKAPAAPEPTRALPPRTRQTVVVVEDEAGIRSLVRKILERYGYDVLEAANGVEALAIFRDHRGTIDLLITDMLMPQMGGRELVDRLRQQGLGMKVLYVSGYTDDATVYLGDLPAGTAFLQKPFTLGSLMQKVREILS